MVEWEEGEPLRCIEIITLDDSNNLSGGFPVITYGNPKGLPLESVGRIYAGNGSSTGFLYNSAAYGLVVISTMHSYLTSFDLHPPTYINIVFNLAHNFTQDKHSPHGQHPDYRQLKPILKSLNTQLIQNDPISDCPYSLPNDIIIYELLNVCICGITLPQLQTVGLEIVSYKELTNSEVILLGYPGLLSPPRSFLLKRGLTQQEEDLLRNSMKENQLVWTEGHIEKAGDLLAISNSSAGGMSGSPLLSLIHNSWKVVGILVGGPAVAGHYHLLKLASCVHNDSMFNEYILQFNKLAKSRGFRNYKLISKNILEIKKNYPGHVAIELISTIYYDFLTRICSQITQSKGEGEAKALLNHNLALPLDAYQVFLESLEEAKFVFDPLHNDIVASSKSYCSSCNCCSCIIL